MKKFTIGDRSFRAAIFFVAIGAWHLLSVIVDSGVLVPSPRSTLESLVEIASTPGFYTTLLHTAARSIGGVFAALLAAVSFGVLSKSSGLWRAVIRPMVDFLSAVPIIAIILLAIIWLEKSTVPVFVGFLVGFPITYDNILSSLDRIDRGILEMAKVYRVKKAVVFRDIYMPAMLYGFSDISNTVVSTTLKMVVAGEVLSQPELSIGANLQIQRAYLNTSGVFGWIAIILIVSNLLNKSVDFVKKRFDSREWM